MKKVVLAYSGGLDTSFCVKYLTKELGYEVYTALANTGGFSAEELKAVEERAYALGAKQHVNIDVTSDYYGKCIKYMVMGNVLRNKTYPISVSSERTFQALAIVNYANSIGADAIAHGSTGAGNDQVRFDLTFEVFAPQIEIITPTRDMKLTREYEINYLKENGYEADFTKLEYSINKGVWGTSVGGKETLCSATNLPDTAYPSQLQKEGTESLEIEFKNGEVVGVNGEALSGVAAINKLEAIGSAWAIGRDTHVGDTIVGIKGRVVLRLQLLCLSSRHTSFWRSTHSQSGSSTGRISSVLGTVCLCTRLCTLSPLCVISRSSWRTASATYLVRCLSLFVPILSLWLVSSLHTT